MLVRSFLDFFAFSLETTQQHLHFLGFYRNVFDERTKVIQNNVMCRIYDREAHLIGNFVVFLRMKNEKKRREKGDQKKERERGGSGLCLIVRRHGDGGVAYRGGDERTEG